MVVAYQPIQSQTVVNNGGGTTGGYVSILAGVPSDNRIVTLAKNIS